MQRKLKVCLCVSASHGVHVFSTLKSNSAIIYAGIGNAGPNQSSLMGSLNDLLVASPDNKSLVFGDAIFVINYFLHILG